MIILPAIDILGGVPVRLYKGDYATARQVAADHIETAKKFEADGAEWLHMVDLDGAKSAKPVNAQVFFETARKTSLKVEVGGGIRDMETIDHYVKNGISRVILGSAALKDKELVKRAADKYHGKIAVGIDCKDGYAKADGWLVGSDIYFTELAREMSGIGIEYIIFTDISRDGTLEGVNGEQLKELAYALKNTTCNIIASGGVKDMEDIKICRAIGLYGCIAGKALYNGSLDLAFAIDNV